MRHVHLHILADNIIKCGFGHHFDVVQYRREIETVGKRETSLADVLGAQLTGKVVQPSEDISMYLLQALDASRFKSVKHSTLK